MPPGRPIKVSNQQLLVGAARAIDRIGPGKVTLNDVAREVGVVPATLVNRFGSKRGLLLAVAREGPDRVGEAFTEARDRGAPPLVALVDGLAGLVVDVDSRKAMVNRIAFLVADLSDEEFLRQSQAYAEVFRQRLAELLAEAVERGQLRHADVQQLAKLVHATFNGVMVTWAVDGEDSLESAVRETIEALLAPFRTTSG